VQSICNSTAVHTFNSSTIWLYNYEDLDVITNWREAKHICIQEPQREGNTDSGEDTFREEPTENRKQMEE
jgi:hypothetical protein